MYMRINKELIEKIEKITMVDYETTENELTGCLIPIENIEAVIEDLLFEIKHRDEVFEEFKKYVDDNYKAIPVAEQYGISDALFI
jgi:hypothetical protein